MLSIGFSTTEPPIVSFEKPFGDEDADAVVAMRGRSMKRGAGCALTATYMKEESMHRR